MDTIPGAKKTTPFTFRDLDVWRLARSFSSDIYRACAAPKMRTHYAFCDQIGRAGLSVPSNICEGNDRSSNRESLYFLKVARGSLYEVETQLWIARDVGWMEEETYEKLMLKRGEIERMLGGLIRFRQNRLRSSGAPKS